MPYSATYRIRIYQVYHDMDIRSVIINWMVVCTAKNLIIIEYKDGNLPHCSYFKPSLL